MSVRHMGQSGFLVLSLLTVANPLMQVTQNEWLQFVTNASVAGMASKQRGQSQLVVVSVLLMPCTKDMSLKYAEVLVTVEISRGI